jgi:hypothetical protein
VYRIVKSECHSEESASGRRRESHGINGHPQVPYDCQDEIKEERKRFRHYRIAGRAGVKPALPREEVL